MSLGSQNSLISTDNILPSIRGTRKSSDSRHSWDTSRKSPLAQTSSRASPTRQLRQISANSSLQTTSLSGNINRHSRNRTGLGDDPTSKSDIKRQMNVAGTPAESTDNSAPIMAGATASSSKDMKDTLEDFMRSMAISQAKVEANIDEIKNGQHEAKADNVKFTEGISKSLATIHSRLDSIEVISHIVPINQRKIEVLEKKMGDVELLSKRLFDCEAELKANREARKKAEEEQHRLIKSINDREKNDYKERMMRSNEEKELREREFRKLNLIIQNVPYGKDDESINDVMASLLKSIGIDIDSTYGANRLGRREKANKGAKEYLAPVRLRCFSVRQKIGIKEKCKNEREGGNPAFTNLRVMDDRTNQESCDFKEVKLIHDFIQETQPGATVKMQQGKLMINKVIYNPRDWSKLPFGIEPHACATRITPDGGMAFGSHLAKLSNLYPCSIIDDEGLTHKSAEHMLCYTKAKLCKDSSAMDKTQKETDPYRIKTIMKRIKGPSNWEEMVRDELKKIVTLKMIQHGDIRDLLSSNASGRFYEATRDPKWGIGLTLQQAKQMTVKELASNEDKGQNWFGMILGDIFAAL